MFAIIETGNKQYKVKEGDLIRVEKLEVPDNEVTVLDKVLLIADGEMLNLGKPYIQGANVSALKVKDDKDKKLVIYKYKRRKDSDKKKGHRQVMTVLKIQKINVA